MAMTTNAELLRTVPLFQGMTESAIAAIADLAEPAEFSPGDVLVRQGDPGETLLVIVAGGAAVNQNGIVLRQLASGDFLGEISLIDGGRRTATVTAVDAIHALVVDRAGFDRLMNEHPAVRLGLVMA
jgi:CRP-like cAMP-binding protein